MKETLKRFFIPHAGNGYHPHILHTKRAVLSAAVCIFVKGIVVLSVLLLPAEAFMLPDVLEMQRKDIIAMTNDLRAHSLAEDGRLDRSAEMKTADMAGNHYFEHIGPNHRSLPYFLSQAGYEYAVAGENLAMGFSSAIDVMKAWEDSPTHFSNLVDEDFQDIGVGIQAGTYQGIPTVFVTQHFGRQKDPAASSTAHSASALSVDNSASQVAWEETDAHGMALSATLRALGDVRSAEVLVRGYRIPMEQVKTVDGMFVGSIQISESPASFFRVVTLPSARIVGSDGEVVSASLPWERVLVVSPTPIEKYIRSKSSFAPFAWLFRVEKDVYAGFLLFFFAALMVSVCVEIKKQHPHIIFQTTALLALIAVLFFV